MWKYLLGIYGWSSSKKERKEMDKHNEREYETLALVWGTMIESGKDKLCKSFEDEGNVGDENEDDDLMKIMKRRKQRISIDVLRTDNHENEKEKLTNDIQDSINEPENLGIDDCHQNKLEDDEQDAIIDSNRHMKILHNVLMTYTIIDFETGYVQGMHDLAEPLISVLQEDEHASFWAFKNFMFSRLRGNFNRDQSGINEQLKKVEVLLKLIDSALLNHFVQTGTETSLI